MFLVFNQHILVCKYEIIFSIKNKSKYKSIKI